MSSSSSHSANPYRPRKQNPRRPTVARSKSLIGTIKNFLPASLAAWLGSTDDFATEDTKGKRRNVALSNAGDNLAEDGSSRTKRIRVASPDTSGYLDPPGQNFLRPATQQFQQLQPNHSNFPNRSSSVTLPTTLQQHPRNRHTVSPFRSNSFSRPETISRTMSMDPPYQRSVTRDVTMMSIHRESSMGDLHPSPSRDISMPPVRASLTPQPSGSSFGPAVQQRDANLQPQTRSPLRQHSTLFGSRSGSMSEIPGGYNRPINAAEKALHELDIYKTPLLPTRLRGSPAIPEMFKPKSSRKLILMHEKESPKHSGLSGKNKSRGKEVNGTKPYAGEGGMKKLLSKRKKEAEAEREKEASEAMKEEEQVEEQKDRDQTNRGKDTSPDLNQHQSTAADNVPIFPPATNSRFNVAGEREQSSLRVGRTKTSRNHISRPVSRAKNRFSALYDEDDGEDQAMGEGKSKDQAMGEGKSKDQVILEEVAQNIPVFNIPSGFSFPKEMTPVQHDLTKAKEPPMTALPFSLSNTSSANTADTAQPLAPVSEQSRQPSPDPRPPSTTLSISAVASVAENSSKSIFGNVPLAPSISLIPPTPVAANVPTEVPSTQSDASTIVAPVPSTVSSVPDFFANSSVLTKPTISIITPSSISSAPAIDAENKLWEGERNGQTKNLESRPEQTSFGGAEKPVAALSFFGAALTNGASTTSVFESRAPSTGFGTSAASARSEGGTNASTSLFGPPPKTLDSIPQSLSFNTHKPTELSIATSDSSAVSTETPEVRETVTKPVPEVSKPSSLFGAPSTNSFGGSSISTSPFSQPAASGTASTNILSFGQPPVTTQAGDAVKNPFFNAASSSTPTDAEKKPTFSFAPSAVPAASVFSFAPINSNTSDVSSKPFSFVTAPGRTVTPPKNEEQEFRMEESPTRDMQLNGKQADTESRPPVSFQFGTGSSTPLFGQPSQTTTFPFPALAPNPFAKAENKADDKPPTVSFNGFGQTQQPSTGFPFGKKNPESETVRPPASFSFQPSATTSASSFTFGTPAANHSPFGQATAQGSSSPSSPATFNQPSQFSFTQPAAASSNPFTFSSSQPASPAVGNSNLPQSTPGGFNFSHSGGTTPTSPFSATAPAPPTGGALFTIGAPPAPAPGGAGRTFKKLPNRRGAKR